MRNSFIARLIALVLIVALSAAAVHAGPPSGPETSSSGGLLLDDEGNKTSIWRNLWKYYQKTREWAKTYVHAVNTVSDLLYGTYSMLKKWEDISKKVDWLMHTNPFDGEGVTDRIENAENWFRTSDQLFFQDVPTAMKEREMLSAKKDAMVKAFRGGGNATIGSEAAQVYADKYQEGYLRERSIRKNPAKDGRIFMSAEEQMLQQLIAQNAKTMAHQHEQSMLLQQEDAVNQAIGQDVYEMVDCQDPNVCGGVAQRTDAEYRMSMLDQRQALLARRQSEASTGVQLQDVLAATQVYVTQGIIVTAYLGAAIRFQRELCDANGLSDLKVAEVSYQWGALYPRAYKYDGKVYGPDVHYYDTYK